MGATRGQLALMDLWAWWVAPSTGRSVYGAAPSTGATPATGRLTGPYRARLTSDRRPGWSPENAYQGPSGTLIVATTVAPSTTVVGAVVSATTVSTAGKTYPSAGLRVFYDDTGIHHATMTVGRTP